MEAWPEQVLNGHVNKGRAPSVHAWCDALEHPGFWGDEAVHAVLADLWHAMCRVWWATSRGAVHAECHMPADGLNPGISVEVAVAGDEHCVVVLPALQPQAIAAATAGSQKRRKAGPAGRLPPKQPPAHFPVPPVQPARSYAAALGTAAVIGAADAGCQKNVAAQKAAAQKAAALIGAAADGAQAVQAQAAAAAHTDGASLASLTAAYVSARDTADAAALAAAEEASAATHAAAATSLGLLQPPGFAPVQPARSYAATLRIATPVPSRAAATSTAATKTTRISPSEMLDAGFAPSCIEPAAWLQLVGPHDDGNDISRYPPLAHPRTWRGGELSQPYDVRLAGGVRLARARAPALPILSRQEGRQSGMRPIGVDDDDTPSDASTAEPAPATPERRRRPALRAEGAPPRSLPAGAHVTINDDTTRFKRRTLFAKRQGKRSPPPELTGDSSPEPGSPTTGPPAAPSLRPSPSPELDSPPPFDLGGMGGALQTHRRTIPKRLRANVGVPPPPSPTEGDAPAHRSGPESSAITSDAAVADGSSCPAQDDTPTTFLALVQKLQDMDRNVDLYSRGK